MKRFFVEAVPFIVAACAGICAVIALLTGEWRWLLPAAGLGWIVSKM